MEFKLVLTGVCSVALAVACATTAMPVSDSGSTNATASTQQASSTGASQTNTGREFKNLQILPKDITHDELIGVMRGFSRSLGVHCAHCHLALTGQAPDALDFASDEKSEKRVARVMMRMTRNINTEYLAKVNEHDSEVTCWTCHRGQVTPPTYAIEKTPVPAGMEPGPPPPPRP